MGDDSSIGSLMLNQGGAREVHRSRSHHRSFSIFQHSHSPPINVTNSNVERGLLWGARDDPSQQWT